MSTPWLQLEPTHAGREIVESMVTYRLQSITLLCVCVAVRVAVCVAVCVCGCVCGCAVVCVPAGGHLCSHHDLPGDPGLLRWCHTGWGQVEPREQEGARGGGAGSSGAGTHSTHTGETLVWTQRMCCVCVCVSPSSRPGTPQRSPSSGSSSSSGLFHRVRHGRTGVLCCRAVVVNEQRASLSELA